MFIALNWRFLLHYPIGGAMGISRLALWPCSLALCGLGLILSSLILSFLTEEEAEDQMDKMHVKALCKLCSKIRIQVYALKILL